MPSPDPSSPKAAPLKPPSIKTPVSKRAEHLKKALDWVAAKKLKSEFEKESAKHPGTVVVIYSERVVGHHYWRQDPDQGDGTELGRAPEDSQLVGYELFRVPAELVAANGLVAGDSDDLKNAIQSALDGGGQGPGSDVGPK